MNAEQKALRACADYARLNAEIKRLKIEIGDCIAKCPGVFYKEIHNSKGDLIAMNATGTHLTEAYACDTDDSGRYFLEPVEQIKVLSACPPCLAAHEAIQARKAARRSLGAAKRAITMLGRAANKEQA